MRRETFPCDGFTGLYILGRHSGAPCQQPTNDETVAASEVPRLHQDSRNGDTPTCTNMTHILMLSRIGGAGPRGSASSTRVEASTYAARRILRSTSFSFSVQHRCFSREWEHPWGKRIIIFPRSKNILQSAALIFTGR